MRKVALLLVKLFSKKDTKAVSLWIFSKWYKISYIMLHNPMYMSDYVEHLDNILKTTGEKILQGFGTISHAQAIEKATAEYRKYQVQNLWIQLLD